MGNASAKEGENGHMAATAAPELVARNGGGSSSAGGATAGPPPLSPPDAVMLEQPPPVPYLFAPQVRMIYCPRKAKNELCERKISLLVMLLTLSLDDIVSLPLLALCANCGG